MTCPDCSGALVEITLSGIDKSFRCFRCGGIWVKDNTLDELSVKALEGWKLIKFDNSALLAGNNRCPQDGETLKIFNNKVIPENWNVRKCEKCHSWWWATDTLFRVRNVISDHGGYLKVGKAIEDEMP